MIEPLHLTPLQQTAAIIGAIVLVGFIVYLIYRGKLREDYGAIWFAAAVVTLILAVWQDGLRLIAATLDAVTLTAPVFLLGILFLIAIAIHFSVRFTTLSGQVRLLAREVALLRAKSDVQRVDPLESEPPAPSSPAR